MIALVSHKQQCRFCLANFCRQNVDLIRIISVHNWVKFSIFFTLSIATRRTLAPAEVAGKFGLIVRIGDFAQNQQSCNAKSSQPLFVS